MAYEYADKAFPLSHEDEAVQDYNMSHMARYNEAIPIMASSKLLSQYGQNLGVYSQSALTIQSLPYHCPNDVSPLQGFHPLLYFSPIHEHTARYSMHKTGYIM